VSELRTAAGLGAGTTGHGIACHLHRTLGFRFEPPAVPERLVAEGRLGRNSGRGFYSWTDA
jgi:3-hydroxybutyryl-CoA dehydrogenase